MALALSARVGLPTQRRGCDALRARAPATAPPRHTRSVTVSTAEPLPLRATPTDANAPTPIAGYAGGGRPLTPNKKKAEKAKACGAAPPKPVIPKALACPCCSGAAYTDCCGQYHAGGVEPDAEAVLRARYSAYVKGDEAAAKYIVSSTHPRSRDLARKGEPNSKEAVLQLLTDTAATMKNVRFQVRCATHARFAASLTLPLQSLDVTRNERGATENEWFISFRATYEPASAKEVARKPHAWREATSSKFLIEKSRFLKDAADGRWKFMSSLTLSAPLGTHGASVMPPAAPAEPPAAA